MNIKPAFISAISVVLSAIVAGVMFLNKDILKPPPKEEAVFTSIEFDADDTSYSPAETHSMNQLSKELAALKDKLLSVRRSWMLGNQQSQWNCPLWKTKNRSFPHCRMRLLRNWKISRIVRVTICRRSRRGSTRTLQEDGLKWDQMWQALRSKVGGKTEDLMRRCQFLKPLNQMRRLQSLHSCIIVMKIF